MYRECRSLQLPILVDMLLLSLFFCSHVGGTGAEWKWYIAVNCWLFNHKVLCRVCWFRHFAPRTMLLHSLPIKCLYTLWGSINLHNIQCIVFPTVNSGTLTQESQFSWYLQVAETYMYVLRVAVYCFSKLNVFWVQFSKLVFANYG